MNSQFPSLTQYGSGTEIVSIRGPLTGVLMDVHLVLRLKRLKHPLGVETYGSLQTLWLHPGASDALTLSPSAHCQPKLPADIVGHVCSVHMSWQRVGMLDLSCPSTTLAFQTAS